MKAVRRLRRRLRLLNAQKRALQRELVAMHKRCQEATARLHAKGRKEAA